MSENTKLIEKTPEAYAYPLLIKQLLHTPIIHSPDQEIVYRDTKRFTYRDFYKRVNRLGSGLKALGVKPGDVVAFLDWDSYRYLEAYFAVPGLGAILHCVNVRLSPEQILWTMKHAEGGWHGRLSAMFLIMTSSTLGSGSLGTQVLEALASNWK